MAMTMFTQKITQAQIDYVLAHINDRPRRKVIEDAGLSVSAFYGIVRNNGGELRHDLSTRREGIEEVVRRYYPTMTGREISERFGYSRSRVIVWARLLGVRHTPETERRIRRERLARLAEGKKHIDHKALGVKLRRIRRTDELRFLSGLPQRTRFRFSTLSRQGRATVWRMVNKRNYFQTEGDNDTLYYDGETRRVPTEEYLSKKYGIRFLPADDYNENGQQNPQQNEDNL